MTITPDMSEFQVLAPKRSSLRHLLQDLEAADSMVEVVGTFARFPSEFGFDWASIVVVNSGRQHVMRNRILTTLPERPRSALFSNGLIRNHHAIKRTIATRQPQFFSSDTLFDTALRTGCIEAHEAKAGMAFLIEHQSDLEAVVLLHTHKKSPWSKLQYAAHRQQIYGTAEQLLDALVYFGSVGFTKENSLCEDELRFIRLLATADDPKLAKSTKYSFGTAVNLQRSIARKLGVNSLFQAVALCAKRGLIDRQEPRVEEIIHTRGFMDGWNDF